MTVDRGNEGASANVLGLLDIEDTRLGIYLPWYKGRLHLIGDSEKEQGVLKK